LPAHPGARPRSAGPGPDCRRERLSRERVVADVGPAGCRRFPHAYATFHIQGTYISSTNHFSGDIDRVRFTLRCRRPGYDEQLKGPTSWQERLCMAILDSRTRTPLQGTACRCAASLARVDVRGVIRGRTVREVITPCLCGDRRQGAVDARIILRTRPQKTGDTT
jgi:hypothetical protein